MPRFPLDALLDLAGPAAFARGQDYAARGLVRLISAGAAGVIATVRGTEAWQVRLTGGNGTPIGGHCTCPAFERDGFCKHLVATGLAADAAGDEAPDRLTPIRAHLLSLGEEALVSMLLDQAARDPALLRRLDLAATAAGGGSVKQRARRLRDALDAALTAGEESGDWAELAEALEQAGRLVRAGGAAEARSLAEFILDELPEALGREEDSDGSGTAALEAAVSLHHAACAALRPDPAELAADLFERAGDDEFGAFDRADERYADLLGPAGLDAYQRLAEAALARLPAIGRGGADPLASDRRWLIEVLDRFAERAGDLDRRIALRRQGLSSGWDYLGLARFCLAHGRAETAREVAEEGVWLFEETADRGLVEFLAERLEAEGRAPDALAVLWGAYERQPSPPVLAALMRIGGAEVVDRALPVLRAARARGVRPLAWDHGALLQQEVEVLAGAGRLAEAWEVARRDGASGAVLLWLAGRSEAAMPSEAVWAYRRSVEAAIGLTGRGGYEEACKLLARLAPLESAGAHIAFVEELRTRHRAKRTLVPMLDRHLESVRRDAAAGVPPTGAPAGGARRPGGRISPAAPRSRG